MRYPGTPSAIWRIDYNSLEREILGLLGPGDLIPCLGTYNMIYTDLALDLLPLVSS